MQFLVLIQDEQGGGCVSIATADKLEHTKAEEISWKFLKNR
jgi:hypothetical protein